MVKKDTWPAEVDSPPASVDSPAEEAGGHDNRRGRWQKPNARADLGSGGHSKLAEPPRSSQPEWTPIVQPALLLAGIGFALQFLMGVFFMAAQGGILWTGLLQRAVVSLVFVGVGLLVLVALRPFARRPFAGQIAAALVLTIPAAMLTMARLGSCCGRS